MKFLISLIILVTFNIHTAYAQLHVSMSESDPSYQAIRDKMVEFGFTEDYVHVLVSFSAQKCVEALKGYEVRAGMYLVIQHQLSAFAYEILSFESLTEPEGIQFLFDLTDEYVAHDCRVKLYPGGAYDVDYIRP